MPSPSISIPITILILTLILTLVLILIFKPVNKGTGITNFKASLFTAVNGVPIINFSFTTPSSFGNNDATYADTLFYVVECPDGTCPSSIQQPTYAEINSQPCLKAGLAPNVKQDDITGNTSVVNTEITGKMDTSFYFQDNYIKQGKNYMFGISIMNSSLQQDGTKLFGDFVYAQIGIPLDTPPGPISAFNANIKK